jgi:serine/threonine protein phosphatase 1
MLSRFLRPVLSGKSVPGEGPAPPAPLPQPDPPVCVVGDVHGCAALLERLLEQIATRDRSRPAGAGCARLILAGDMIDRGPDSAAVLARVQALCAADRAVALMGNHERLMLDFLDAPARSGPLWRANGGDATLLSLGVNPHRSTDPDRLAADLRAALPPGTEDWLRALPLTWRPEEPGAGLAVSHAGADPARPFEDQDDRALLWGHRDFRRRMRADGLWIVHGHVITREVLAEDGRIGVDTGAFATGRLSAVWLDRDGMQVLEARAA